MKKKDPVLIGLIVLSIILIIYSLFYFINYYSYNDLLFHFPESVDDKNLKLPPNEIGDSIGGVLNPIIAFSASVLTFLAFYIQFKANNEQRKIFQATIKKEKTIEHNRHKANINIFKALINSMTEYYNKSGDLLIEFINREEENPLEINYYAFLTNSSYENFNKLNLRDIYSSIAYSFENNDENENWENNFIDTLTIVDFYHKLITELKIKFEIHVKSKSDNLNSVGEVLNKNIGDILSDPYLSSFDGIEDYIAIVYNKDNSLNPIIPDKEFKGISFSRLQDEFFKKFLTNLKKEYDKENDPKFKKLLELYSFENKRIGKEKFQTLKYIENLKKQHSRFSEGKEFDKIKEFLERINIS
ncbi:hypothetical protein [Aureibaculum luteum]|uniref:hypothetical protein n=1 Tax=Aureibaculum luteum TaxID=1548456 RepID=UPI000E4FE599|nr:hypothetical protein [Aureibaculum luteum]